MNFNLSDTLMTQLAERIQRHSLSLAVAESCTGGLMAGALTHLPGASAYFMGGIVAYSNAAKQNLLSVPPECINSYGAVSALVAEAMAFGVAQRFHVPVALSCTGIAGPDGGSREKPVGTVWLGLFFNNSSHSKLIHLSGSREYVRQQTVEHAFTWLLEHFQLFEQVPEVKA